MTNAIYSNTESLMQRLRGMLDLPQEETQNSAIIKDGSMAQKHAFQSADAPFVGKENLARGPSSNPNWT